MDNGEKIVHKLYTHLDSPVLFSNEGDLIREARRHGVSRKKVQSYLRYHSNTYNRHKQAPKRFKRSTIKAAGVGTHFQIDLADMRKYAKENARFAWIFVAWDAFTKRLFAYPMYSKKPKEVKRIFKTKFMRDLRPNRPRIITHDDGSEYKGEFSNYLYSQLIAHRIAPHSRFKTAGAERAIRSIKTRLEKYMTEKKTKAWKTALKPIIDSLNAQPKRALKNLRPIDIKNEAILLENATKRDNTVADVKAAAKGEEDDYRYAIGDTVRIRLDEPDVGHKGYKARYSNRLFVVVSRKIRPHGVAIYRLADYETGQTVDGIFYTQELSHGG